MFIQEENGQTSAVFVLVDSESTRQMWDYKWVLSNFRQMPFFFLQSLTMFDTMLAEPWKWLAKDGRCKSN